MYCIKKFADCWAIFNLDSEDSRSLTDYEVLKVREAIPELNASDVLSYYTDEIDCIDDKP
jgi:hypothetical protein